MRYDSRFIAVGALALATACNGAQTPKPTSPEMPDTRQQIATDDAPGGGTVVGTPSVAPVPAPGDVVLHLRWANPGRTAATMAGYANLPASQINDMLSQGVKEIIRDELSGKVDVDAFANLVRTDAPIDVVVVADFEGGGQVPDPMVVISLGLSSVQAALSTSKGQPRKIGEGVWEIGTQDKWGDPCAISAAAGKAPARLVCGDRKKHVEKMAAFVSRNIASQPDTPHDIRLHVGLRGLLDEYGDQWASQAKGLPVFVEEAKIGIPKFDQALMDAADAVAEEAGHLIHDADSFTVDIGLDATKGAHVGVELKFAGQKSWLVQTMVDGAQSSGPAPDIVWQVPAKSEYVAWGISGDPQRFTGVVKAARAMIEGALEKENIGTAADRKAMANLVRLVSQNKHVPAVFAAGHFANVNTNPTSITHVVEDVVGWYLLGYDEKPAALKKWLQDAIKVYKRPSLQKLMKDEMGPSDAKHLPRVKSIGVPPGLGGGALAIEIVVPDVEDPLDPANNGPPVGNAKPKTVDLRLYVLLIGDGARSWLGIAPNKLELAKLMATLKTKGAGRLANRADLGRLKSESHTGGAFTSLEGFVGMAKPIIYALMAAPGAGSSKGMGQEILKVIGQMPNQGATPILMFSDVVPGSSPTVTWSLDVPRGTLEDIGFLVESGLKMAMP